MSGRGRGGRQPNPFEEAQRGGREHSVKYCAWEVLRHYPQGLNVTQIAREIQERGLKDFSEKKNAAGQVSGDLVRGKDVFWHDPDKKLWWIWPMAPNAKKQAKRRKGAGKARKPSGEALVGCRASVWWDGENAFFGGRIDSYDGSADRYKVVYDDGDADPALEFRNYEVSHKGGRIEVVTVTATDADDVDAVPAGHAPTGVVEEAAREGLPLSSRQKGKEGKGFAGSRGQPKPKGATAASVRATARTARRAPKSEQPEPPAGTAEPLEPLDVAHAADGTDGASRRRGGRRGPQVGAKRSQNTAGEEEDRAMDNRRSKRIRATVKIEEEDVGPGIEIPTGAPMSEEEASGPLEVEAGPEVAAVEAKGQRASRRRRPASPTKLDAPSPPPKRHATRLARQKCQDEVKVEEHLEEVGTTASPKPVDAQVEARPKGGEGAEVGNADNRDGDADVPVRKSWRLLQKQLRREGQVNSPDVSIAESEDEMADPRHGAVEEMSNHSGSSLRAHAQGQAVRDGLEKDGEVKMMDVPEVSAGSRSARSPVCGDGEPLQKGARPTEAPGESSSEVLVGNKEEGVAKGAVSKMESSGDSASTGPTPADACVAAVTAERITGGMDGRVFKKAKADKEVRSISGKGMEGDGCTPPNGSMATEIVNGTAPCVQQAGKGIRKEAAAAPVSEAKHDVGAGFKLEQQLACEPRPAAQHATANADPVATSVPTVREGVKRLDVQARKKLSRMDPFLLAPRPSECGPSIKSLSMTETLVLRSKLPLNLSRLGDITELMSISQLSQELKSVGESGKEEDKGESEISSAPPEDAGADVQGTANGGAALGNGDRRHSTAVSWSAATPSGVDECAETPANSPDGGTVVGKPVAGAGLVPRGDAGVTASSVGNDAVCSGIGGGVAQGPNAARLADVCPGVGQEPAMGSTHSSDGKAVGAGPNGGQSSGNGGVGPEGSDEEAACSSECGREVTAGAMDASQGSGPSSPKVREGLVDYDTSPPRQSSREDEGDDPPIGAQEDSGDSVGTRGDDKAGPMGNGHTDHSQRSVVAACPLVVNMPVSEARERHVAVPISDVSLDECSPESVQPGEVADECGVTGGKRGKEGCGRGFGDRPSKACDVGGERVAAEDGRLGEPDSPARAGESKKVRAGGCWKPCETKHASSYGRSSPTLGPPRRVHAPPPPLGVVQWGSECRSGGSEQARPLEEIRKRYGDWPFTTLLPSSQEVEAPRTPVNRSGGGPENDVRSE